MAKNTNKNTGGVTGKGFDVLGQPTPEAKSAGWDKRRQRERFISEFENIQSKSIGDINRMQEDAKKNPDDYTLMQVKILEYLTSNKFTDKLIDKYIPNAKTEIELSGGLSNEQSVDLSGLNKEEKQQLYDTIAKTEPAKKPV